MVFVYTAMGVLCVEHANVLELCYIELLSGDGSPYSILSGKGLPLTKFQGFRGWSVSLRLNDNTICKIQFVIKNSKQWTKKLLRLKW